MTDSVDTNASMNAPQAPAEGDDHVAFIAMKDGSYDDYALLERHEAEHVAGLADRILVHLQLQAGGFGGYKIDRLQHSLQTATRAERDQASDDWIFAALMHDIGDTIAPQNHSAMAAAIIRPYISEEIYNVVLHHGVFQGYYYNHHYNGDRHARDRFKDKPFYDATLEFCERWDQSSFDPDYATLPLAHFEPLVREIFARSPSDRFATA